jgi:RecB family exonuclease
LGVSEEKSQGPPFAGPLDFFTPQEKEHLNHCLKSDLFELPYERKERTRQLLRYLASSGQRLKLSYVSDPRHDVNPRPSLVEEFLIDYPTASFEKAIASSFPKEMSAQYTYETNQLKELVCLPSVYSVRSLSQYQRCPYGFFLKECLGFYPKAIDQKWPKRLTAAEEGEIYHDILFRFFSGSNKIGYQIPLVQRLKIEKTVSLFLAEEKEWRQISRFKPRYFEHSFEIELKEGGKSIFLRGKIDRVDVDEERKEFVIIDYKTGGDLPSAKEVMAGRDFQLVIYAIAMEELFLRGYRPFQGFCYHVKKIKSKKLFEAASQDDWEALKKRTLNEVFSIISEIKKREFIGTPENCYSGCELRGICASAAVQSFN